MLELPQARWICARLNARCSNSNFAKNKNEATRQKSAVAADDYLSDLLHRTIISSVILVSPFLTISVVSVLFFWAESSSLLQGFLRRFDDNIFSFFKLLHSMRSNTIEISAPFGILIWLKYLMVRHRVRSGVFGYNPVEASQIVEFIIKKRKSDGGDGGGWEQALHIYPETEKAPDFIPGLLNFNNKQKGI